MKFDDFYIRSYVFQRDKNIGKIEKSKKFHTRRYLLVENAENEDSVMPKYVKSHFKQLSLKIFFDKTL